MVVKRQKLGNNISINETNNSMDTSSCVIRHVERVDRKKKSDMVGLFSQWEFPTLHTTWVVRMLSSASGELESGREGSSLPGNTVGHLPRPIEGSESHSLGGIPVPSDQAQRVPPALPEIPGQTQTNMPPGHLHYDDSPKFIWARKWYSENSLMKWSSPFRAHQNCIFIFVFKRTCTYFL